MELVGARRPFSYLNVTERLRLTVLFNVFLNEPAKVSGTVAAAVIARYGQTSRPHSMLAVVASHSVFEVNYTYETDKICR